MEIELVWKSNHFGSQGTLGIESLWESRHSGNQDTMAIQSLWESSHFGNQGSCVRRVLNISLGLLITYLSIPVILNLLSSRQVMNTSFNSLRIVNTYGAFGRKSPAVPNVSISSSFPKTYEQNEWIIHLAGKLLAQEEEILSLLATNPFAGRDPPRWIRGEHFRYKFSQPGGKHAAQGKWWIRKRIGPYFPPVSLQGLKKFFQDRNWPYPVQA
ncbi:lipase maturation factor 1-like protein [Turdus rufiventris]|nr:lipase maturation factor 1-like protein [Turdus rufiventris]